MHIPSYPLMHVFITDATIGLYICNRNLSHSYGFRFMNWETDYGKSFSLLFVCCLAFKFGIYYICVDGESKVYIW